MTTPSPSGPAPLSRWLLLLFLSLFVLGADQGTKALVKRHLPLYRHVVLIPGIFDLTHLQNDGAAFSLFAGRKSKLQAALFYLVSAVAFGVILYNLTTVPISRYLFHVGLYLVVGGAAGNLLDRIRFGAVVDFLDVHYRGFVWPTFNVADSSICVGVAIMIVECFLAQKAEKLAEGEA